METNRHHVFFPRRSYNSKTERNLRNHPFMIIKIDVERHKELHACIQPPLKLTAQQMIGALSVLEEMRGEPLQAHERLLELADYLDGRESREQRVGANLRLQASFIEEGA